MKSPKETRGHVRFFTFSLTLIAALTFLTAGQASGAIQITVGSVSPAAPGSNVQVPVNLIAGSEEPSTIVLKLEHHAKLTYRSVVLGPAANNAGKAVEVNSSPGFLGLAVYEGKASMDDGLLLTVTFAVSNDAADNEVLDVGGTGSAANPNAIEIPLVLTGGTVTVEAVGAVATPQFSPAPGSYTSAQNVTITCATAGATIRYTTNGSDPTESSTAYSSPVPISTTTTLKAKAWKSGMTASGVQTGAYAISPPGTVATPEFSPPPGSYTSAQNVAITCATAGATIRYTTNGSDPTESSTAYSSPVAISTTTTLKAKAWKSGMTASGVQSGTYTITPPGTVATPEFSPLPGTYTSAQNVTISCATAGATIRYTTTGSDPTESSTVYTGPVSIAATKTLKAKAWKSGMTASAVQSGKYTITPPGTVATPDFSPPPGTYTSAQNVTITCATAGAAIRYTTNGSDPTESSTAYTDSVVVAITSTKTLKAKAWKSGMTASDVQSGIYTIAPAETVATPEFSPAPGTYDTAQSVTITCATGGATIHYTTDGSEPTESSATYGAPVAIASTTTLKAKAWKSGMTASGVQSGIYTITLADTVATPEFSPAPGTYDTAQDVTITCATGGATIRYTTDGSDPTESSTAYASPVAIGSTTTLKAKAWKSGMTASGVQSGTYTITCSAPSAPTNVSATDGTFTDKVQVTWNAVSGADQYQVYRDSTAVSGWQSGLSYDDTGAQAPVVTPASGCGGKETITYKYHNYRVKAKNSCGESDFSAANSGHRGASKALDPDLKIHEEAFPASAADPLSELALRLTSAEPIDPATVWARAEGDGWCEEGGLWRPTVPDDDSDGWVVVAPAAPWPAGGTVLLTAGALTVTGAEVGPVSRAFQLGEEKEGLAPAEPTIAELAGDADLPVLLADVLSPAYRIGPDRVFEEAAPFWIPVPEGADPNTLEIYYFSEAEEHRGWYRGENVLGWMAPDSRAVVEENGQLFIEIQVNHAGIVQLADAQSVKVLADAGVFLAFAALLGMKFARRNRKK